MPTSFDSFLHQAKHMYDALLALLHYISAVSLVTGNFSPHTEYNNQTFGKFLFCVNAAWSCTGAGTKCFLHAACSRYRLRLSSPVLQHWHTRNRLRKWPDIVGIHCSHYTSMDYACCLPHLLGEANAAQHDLLTQDCTYLTLAEANVCNESMNE